MKLSIGNKTEYLHKVYASWLGKLIGIRLGAPVEGWTHDKIMEKYPDEEGYLVDYDIFAADDDSNGPLFFIRALLDHDEISAEKIGDTFLNYLCEYHGFFWWGGVGVSSEHTAYENLKKGIKAPLSGSKDSNGIAIAEQIGGQIFSDCWGYVAGYDPLLAKKLAAMASSVTHDENGIEGGIFVAVSIALAMQMDDIHKVIDEAVKYLDPEKEYYRVAKDIIRFYESDRSDWNHCLKYIQEHYGYDKYPGVCHIIPNMALMIMAMCYGENDFDRTMVMLNRSGWDTDCNCGNVGSIMGALLGLEGISEKWIRPINDVIDSSSAVGCLNIQYASESAMMFTRLAYRLQGMKIDEFPQFALPYGTRGIRCSDGSIEVKNDQLYVNSKDIYTYAYYLSDDIYDARYDPEFSPLLGPGDTVSVSVHNDNICDYESYVIDCEGNEYKDTYFIEGDDHIDIHIPKGKNFVVNKIGIRSKRPYRIKEIRVIRKPCLEYDFNGYPLEHYGPRYEGDCMNNIRAFVKHSGEWDIEGGLRGFSREHALISSGCYGNEYSHIEWDFEMEKGDEACLVFGMRGYLDLCRLGIRKDQIVAIDKKKDEKMIVSYPAEVKSGIHHLVLDRKDGKLSVVFDGRAYQFPDRKLNDLFGVYLGADCICRTYVLKLY